MKKLLLSLVLVLTLTSCIGVSIGGEKEGKSEYPIDPRDKRRLDRGKLSGDGGIKLLGKNSGASATMNINGIGVNSVLWRASLDALSFMPLASADSFGGVIITEWYQDKKNSNERYKLNVFILDSALRADALKVSVFKQKRVDNEWQDIEAPEKMTTDIEDKILTKARQKRIDLMTK